RCRPDTELLEDAGLWLTEYHRLSSGKDGNSLHQPPSIIWQPPAPERLKLNVDVSTDGRSHLMGVGAVVRDDRG
ncbi:hypothetical protein TorRG33x02_201670, partial [Trema orientale]